MYRIGITLKFTNNPKCSAKIGMKNEHINEHIHHKVWFDEGRSSICYEICEFENQYEYKWLIGYDWMFKEVSYR